jgi:peptidyl-prolyl cis-trans isomerase B (cyclophilin B)
VSSVRDSRQRAAARAKLEREMTARLESARRKKILQARIGGGVALVLVLGVIAWILVAATGDDSTPSAQPSTPSECVWIPNEFEPTETASAGASASAGRASSSADASATAEPAIKKPPANPPRSGYQVVTFNTNLGAVKVEMNLTKTPCTAASLVSLAEQKYYDGTSCHRLVASIFALQCGDPTGQGTGGPGYRFADENLPKDKLPAYHAGDVAMANTGQEASNGSQFFFLWQNTTLQGDYSLFGRVIEGLDIVKKVADGGDDGAFEGQGQAGGGHPKTKFQIKTVTVGPVTPTSAAVATTVPATSTASTTPSVSAS